MKYLSILILTILISIFASTAIAQDNRRDCFGDPLPRGAVARLGSMRYRLPNNRTQAMVFLSDHKTLATIGLGQRLLFWDVATGRPSRAIAVPKFSTAKFSANGKWLALQLSRKEPHIALMALATGKVKYRIEQPFSWWEISANGERIVGVNKKQMVFVWNRQTQKMRAVTRWKNETTEVHALSSDGKLLLWSTLFEPLHVLNLQTGKDHCEPFQPYQAQGRMVFSSDNKRIALRGYNSYVEIWDTKMGTKIRDVDKRIAVTKEGKTYLPDYVEALQFSPDGQHIAGTINGYTVRVWDCTNGKHRDFVSAKSVSNDGIMQFCFSQDGNWLAAHHMYSNLLHIWNVKTGKHVAVPSGHRGEIHRLAFLNGKNQIATHRENGTVRIWQAMTGIPLRTIALKSKKAEVYLGKSGRMATAQSYPVRGLALFAKPANFQITDLTNGKSVATFRGSGGLLESVTLSPDGKHWLTVNQFGRKDIYDTKTGRRVQTLYHKRGHKSNVQSSGSRVACYSDDGTRIAIYEKGYINIWSTKTGKQINAVKFQTQYRILELRFSPDNLFVLVSVFQLEIAGSRLSDFLLENTATSTLDMTHAIHAVHIGTGQQYFPADRPQVGKKLGKVAGLYDEVAIPFAVSPRGHMLAVGQGDTIYLVEMITGKKRALVGKHHSRVSALDFSASGQYLAAGYEDSTALIWDVDQTNGSPMRLTTPAQALQAWQDLSSTDAQKAYRAIRALSAHPKWALSVFDKHLRAVAPYSKQQLQTWIKELDARKFSVRQRVARKLREEAELIKPYLEKVYANPPSLEVQQRLRILLRKMNKTVFSTEKLQRVRAIEVLENIGTPAAQAILQRLAKGAPAALSTQRAKTAAQ